MKKSNDIHASCLGVINLIQLDIIINLYFAICNEKFLTIVFRVLNYNQEVEN